jgi:hypothetical protein
MWKTIPSQLGQAREKTTQPSTFSLMDYRQTISATSKAAQIAAPLRFFESRAHFFKIMLSITTGDVSFRNKEILACSS